MADIDVVPKRGAGALIWLLVALAVVAVLLWFLFGFGADTTPDTIGSSWQPSQTQLAWSGSTASQIG